MCVLCPLSHCRSFSGMHMSATCHRLPRLTPPRLSVILTARLRGSIPAVTLYDALILQTSYPDNSGVGITGDNCRCELDSGYAWADDGCSLRQQDCRAVSEGEHCTSKMGPHAVSVSSTTCGCDVGYDRVPVGCDVESGACTCVLATTVATGETRGDVDQKGPESSTIVPVLLSVLGIAGVVAGIVYYVKREPAKEGAVLNDKEGAPDLAVVEAGGGSTETMQLVNLDESTEATGPSADTAAPQPKSKLGGIEIPKDTQSVVESIAFAVLLVFVIVICIVSEQPAKALVCGAIMIVVGYISAGYGYRLWYYTVFAFGFLLGSSFGYVGYTMKYAENNYQWGEELTCPADCELYAMGGAIFCGVITGGIFLALYVQLHAFPSLYDVCPTRLCRT
jgi:hypothetical protein